MSETKLNHLGKNTEYKTQKDKTLLDKIVRNDEREKFCVIPTQFQGYDVWMCYEISAIIDGIPQNFIGKITWDAAYFNTVESKSLKLYLNSLNNTTFTSIRDLENTIADDLWSRIGNKATVNLWSTSAYEKLIFENYNTNNIVNTKLDFPTDLLKAAYGDQRSLLKEYNLPPAEKIHLNLNNGVIIRDKPIYLNCYFDHLRSNCKVTGQPDWGSAYISILTRNVPQYIELTNLLYSFRHENHFHEEVCEQIYYHILHAIDPVCLTVTCKYMRRGGIDISCVRTTNLNAIADEFKNSSVPLIRDSRQ
jgi:7-cyano-7-deazaguanine reductase